MSKLDKNKKIGHDITEGVSISEITKVEQKLNIKFPLAYKEFLLLAGEYTGGLQLGDGHSSLKMLSHPDILKDLKDALIEQNVQITRPFWVISEYNSFEQFYFFYLDENTENPKIFGVTYGAGDNSYIYPLNETFSEFINSIIDKSIHFSKHGY